MREKYEIRSYFQDRERELIHAIVERAIKDVKTGIRYEMKYGRRFPVISNESAEYWYYDALNFFGSEWFECLTDVELSRSTILKAILQQTKKENPKLKYEPITIKELIND